MAKAFGDWKVIESAGEGGQAWTYRVRDSGGQEAILKCIKNPKRAVRFERELCALRDLHSRAVPKYLDSGETDGRPWVVTVDCGRPLPGFVEMANLTQRLSWFIDVITAIRDAHAIGIVHRDVKPDNVVVSSDLANAYLVDFGICAISDMPAVTDVEAFGNAAFAAPECSLGHSDCGGEPADIYSCGKLLYWLTSDRKYIFRENTRDLEDTYMSPHRDLCARIDSTVSQCVRERPSDRLIAGELLKRALALLRYAELLEDEKQNGIVRLVDNLGIDNHFNECSSRSITSAGLLRSDLHPGVGYFGELHGNIALAERFEVNSSETVKMQHITIAVRSSSPVSEVEVQVAADASGVPSIEPLATARLSIVNGPPEIWVLEYNVDLSRGVYWVKFLANGSVPTYASVCIAPNELVPRKSIFAESRDGGMTWETRHTNGGGLALRIEASANRAV